MRWLREPIVHFVALGAALFAIDAAISEGDPPAPTASSSLDDHTIVVTEATLAELRAALRAEYQRDPTDEEVDEQVSRWVTDEALRREALRLGLDDNDPIIRRRLVQNMRFVLEAAEPPPEPTDAEVDAWLAENLPPPEARARIDFTHVFIDGERHAEPDAEAATVAAQLVSGANPSTLGDPFVRGRTFRNVSRPEVSRLLGEQAAAAIMDLRPDGWSAPVPSPYGLHIVRIDDRRLPPADGSEAERDAARRALVRDAARTTEEAAIRAVVDDYEVVREPDDGSGDGV